jgi:hypothetical protein
VGFEPTTPVFERAKIVHALDSAITFSIGYTQIRLTEHYPESKITNPDVDLSNYDKKIVNPFKIILNDIIPWKLDFCSAVLLQYKVPGYLFAVIGRYQSIFILSFSRSSCNI